MPAIFPIPAIMPAHAAGQTTTDVSKRIAPPYDVLDEAGKAKLLAGDATNIVAVDLPHLPAKTVGPDATYEKAGAMYRDWLSRGVLVRRVRPAMFAYQQTYTHAGKRFERRGLIANVAVQPFGKLPGARSGIHPHEQTFSGPKEDRRKLMIATKSQLSPIFGLHSDPRNEVHAALTRVIQSRKPVLSGTTANDGVLHQLWAVESSDEIATFTGLIADRDIFIADGHHRYTTALNYRQGLIDANGGRALPTGHPTNGCLFVLVAMQDPGMIVLPTHRVLGGMKGFSIQKFAKAAEGKLKLTPFEGKSLTELEAALPEAGKKASPKGIGLGASGGHAFGLYVPDHAGNGGKRLWIATTATEDPLSATHGKQSRPWRELDVAIVQHLFVEAICQPAFCGGGDVTWKFPHDVEEVATIADHGDYQLGIVLQPTPLESVRLVSEAGELMPQKSTFFYPKLATGLVINPLE